MADRNRSDLEREQRGSSNPNQTERPEDRSTSAQETGMGKPSNPDRGVGNEIPGDRKDNLDPNRESGNRPSGNIEGDENLNRR